MSIRPIDPLIMNNTPNVEKLASVKASQDENLQAQSAMAVKQDTEHKEHQVSAMNGSVSQNKIDRENEKEKGKKEQQQKKKEKNENENEEGSIIDIRI